MKIESSPKPLVGDPGSVRTNAAKTGSGARSSAAPETDVELSSLSTQLQKIESSQSSAQPVNVERVAEIRQAIAQGDFKIDAGKIADGLIESVRQMLSVQRQ